MARRESTKIDQIIGFVVGGSFMTGVGIGFLNDQLVAGAVLGTGIGLLLAAVIRAFGRV